MACHILGAPNMALQLGAPTSVECIKKEGPSDFMFPVKSVIRYDFPARGTMPPVKVFWHDGLKETPKIPGVPEGELLGDLPDNAFRAAGRARPEAGRRHVYRLHRRRVRLREVPGPEGRAERAHPTPDGSLFIGDKGMITTGTYGEDTRLIPVEKMRDYRFPQPLLTRSPGHYQDWIRACKGGDPACSNFNVAVPFVEWMLLGAIALRVAGKLEWDAAKMRFSNNSEANRVSASDVPQRVVVHVGGYLRPRQQTLQKPFSSGQVPNTRVPICLKVPAVSTPLRSRGLGVCCSRAIISRSMAVMRASCSASAAACCAERHCTVSRASKRLPCGRHRDVDVLGILHAVREHARPSRQIAAALFSNAGGMEIQTGASGISTRDGAQRRLPGRWPRNRPG